MGDGLGKVTFPMRVRVTSVSGEQLEATIPQLRDDFNTPSDIQFSGFSNEGQSLSSFLCLEAYTIDTLDKLNGTKPLIRFI